MQSLRSIEHMLMTENNLKCLTHNRIETILDFLNADVDKICIITKLNLPQVLEIRNHILKKFSSPVLDGITLLNRNHIKQHYLPTGLESLDAILDGGLSIGYISEICGLTDSGKTQLCFQLAINCVKNTNKTVLYIDTKGDFSALRIQTILDSCNLSHKDMAEIMFRIKVVRVWIMEELIDIFKRIKNKTLVFNNLSLIIVDSLPCLMFQHLGDDTKIGLSFLNTFVNYCKFICYEFSICVLCVNIYTRWIDQDLDELEDHKEQSLSTNREALYVEKQNRCLGKYWQLIPLIMFILQKSSDNKDISEIVVTVTNSTNKNCKQCILKISNSGVS